MSIYRPTPISQRDGSEFANVNCRMSGIATGIDYHTLGAITSTGAEMRSRQSDQQAEPIPAIRPRHGVPMARSS